jgi:transposase
MDINFQSTAKRGPRGKYRQHSQEFKRKVVELAMQPGTSVARVARDHGINANQVFTWRRQHEAGLLGAGCPVEASEFLSVVMTPAPTPSSPVPEHMGIITLELGKVRLRIEGPAYSATLALVLDRVLR